MSVECEFDVAVRIIASDGETVVFDFNDHTLGMSVVTRQEPGDETEKSRVVADSVDGDYVVNERDAAGDYVVMVRVEGSSWAQCEQRWLVARAAYRAERHYYLETEVEGVVKRYRTGLPDSVQPGESVAMNLQNHRQTYSIRWRVQPNPLVTIDEEA